MLIAHLADLHLGYRAYHRLGPGGINLRERDVARAFRLALDKIIEIQPELVIVAGDVFHTVRPSNAAIADAFRQFARLSAGLPESRIVIIAGNHDTPRSVESGSILRLFAEIPRITVMDQEARQVRFEDIDAAVLGIPHNAVAEEIYKQADSEAETNVLVLHGAHDEDKLRTLHEYGGVYFDLTDLHPEQFDYVALGHYHIAEELRPNVWYAGAIERTSNNIWAEADSEKGFLTCDTETGTVTFHPIETRPVIDLPRIFDANQFSSAELDARIRKLVDGIRGGIEGKIVRLVMQDIPRELFRELDYRQIREYKAQALHFQIDARRPQVAGIVAGERGRRYTLEEELENFVLHQWQPSTRDIERARVLELAKKYLYDAGMAEAAEISALTGDAEVS